MMHVIAMHPSYCGVGIHPKIAQERLGHTSIQITLDSYSHITPGLQRAAADFDEDLVSRYPTEDVKEVAESVG